MCLSSWRRWLVVFALLMLVAASRLPACPFCSAVQQTFSEEMQSSDAVVIAKVAERKGAAALKAAPGDKLDKFTAPAPVNEPTNAVFEIVTVLKGDKFLKGQRRIQVLYFGQHSTDQQFLIFGSDPTGLVWGTPTPLSARAVTYVGKLGKLPESGAERLAFFQDYLEDADPLLATDAYDEFGKAPYADVRSLKDRMYREKVLSWIANPDIPANRRRLYLTMLGVCGKPEDITVLEKMIKNEDRQVRTALDAMLACYLNLKGPDGVGLVEDLFLKNTKAEYTDTYAAIMALRFHGQEATVVPRDRLLQGMRTMLDRPQLADLVIPDLARWQDWSVVDKLVKLFKEADEESHWVRVPVVNYLRVCPDPKAKTYIEELAKIDPESVRRASQFFPLGLGGQKPVNPVPPSTTTKTTDGAGSTTEGLKSKTPRSSDKPAATGSAGEKKAAEAPPAKKAAAVPPQGTRLDVLANVSHSTTDPASRKSQAGLPDDGERRFTAWEVLGSGCVVGVGLFSLMLVILRGSQSPLVK